MMTSRFVPACATSAAWTARMEGPGPAAPPPTHTPHIQGGLCGGGAGGGGGGGRRVEGEGGSVVEGRAIGAAGRGAFGRVSVSHRGAIIACPPAGGRDAKGPPSPAPRPRCARRQR